MTAPLLVIAAGGTGGHLFPAQALAETMLARGWRVTLSTDTRGARYAGGFPEAVPVEEVPSATFARGGLLAKLGVAPTLARGVLAARRADARRPAGGGRGLRRLSGDPGAGRGVPDEDAADDPRAERRARPGQRAVRPARRRWSPAAPGRPRCRRAPQAVHTGNPVRAAIRDRAESGYIQPGDYPMEILVTGGSQGARILSDVVPPAIAELPREMRRHLRVSHQARAEDVERVATFYEGALVEADVQPFFHDMPRRIAEAQLVIARAGASTVADLSVIGRPAILIPLASAIRDEQTANARGLVGPARRS